MGLFDFLRKEQFEEIDRLKSLLKKYEPIQNVADEVERQRVQFELMVKEHNSNSDQMRIDKEKLSADYAKGLETYNNLQKEIGVFQNKLNLIEYGVYEPVFDFDKSDDYRDKQMRVIDKQKDMISMDTAAVCHTNWAVEGSESKGRAVVNRFKKLMLRAFNGECDVLIAKVKWNNVNQIKERMKKIFDAVNKLGEGFNIHLNYEYLELKQQELTLEYEYQVKKHEEKEAQRLAKETMREEEKARREYEQVQRQAEKEETSYQKALDKARKEIEQTSGAKQDLLQEKIRQLEEELKLAQERKERAISMAEQTKRGHVYVISNIGSFGEHVYKIGMTRRLEPEDRIKELGDASVPFGFDIHAMIFSEDAPALENELHKAFADKKINMLNLRKEFFKVTIDEIESKVKSIGMQSEFLRMAQAKEYKETIVLLEKLKEPTQAAADSNKAEEFPKALF